MPGLALLQLARMAAQAIGAVLTGEGDPAARLAELAAAATAWRSLHMPYEAERAALLRGWRAPRGETRTSAALEFDNAEATFIELGATPDLDRLTALTSGLLEGAAPSTEGEGTSVLSAREGEVLMHLAAGTTSSDPDPPLRARSRVW